MTTHAADFEDLPFPPLPPPSSLINLDDLWNREKSVMLALCLEIQETLLPLSSWFKPTQRPPCAFVPSTPTCVASSLQFGKDDKFYDLTIAALESATRQFWGKCYWEFDSRKRSTVTILKLLTQLTMLVFNAAKKQCQRSPTGNLRWKKMWSYMTRQAAFCQNKHDLMNKTWTSIHWTNALSKKHLGCWMHDMLLEDDGTVYYLFGPTDSYVGQTGGLLSTRNHREFTDARNRHLPSSALLQISKTIRGVGFHKWLVYAICTTPGLSTQQRKRTESWWMTTLMPNQNRTNNWGPARYAKTTRRYIRKPKRARALSETISEANLRQMRSTAIANTPMPFKDDGGVPVALLTWLEQNECQQGLLWANLSLLSLTCYVTKICALYGNSSVTYDRTTLLLKNVLDKPISLPHGQPTSCDGFSSLSIRVVCEQTPAQRWSDKLALLGDHRYAHKYHLRNETSGELAQLIVSIDLKQQTHRVVRIKHAIQQELRRRHDTATIFNMRWTIIFNHKLDIRLLTSNTRRLLVEMACLSKGMRKFIMDKVSITNKKRLPIFTSLVTTSRAFAGWTVDTDIKCPQPLLCQHGHFQMRLRDMPGAAGQIGQMDMRMVPIPTTDDGLSQVHTLIRGMIAKLKAAEEDSCFKITEQHRLSVFKRITNEVVFYNADCQIMTSVSMRRFKSMYRAWLLEQEYRCSSDPSLIGDHDALSTFEALERGDTTGAITTVTSHHVAKVEFWTTAREVLKQSQLDSHRHNRMLPASVAALVSRTFDLKAQLCATSMTCCVSLDMYAKSDHLLRKKYGLLGAQTHLWKLLVLPYPFPHDRYAQLESAIRRADVGGQTIMFLPRDRHYVQKFMKLTLHPHVHKLAHWSPNAFRYHRPISDKPGPKETCTMTLYLVCTLSMLVPLTRVDRDAMDAACDKDGCLRPSYDTAKFFPKSCSYDSKGIDECLRLLDDSMRVKPSKNNTQNLGFCSGTVTQAPKRTFDFDTMLTRESLRAIGYTTLAEQSYILDQFMLDHNRTPDCGLNSITTRLVDEAKRQLHGLVVRQLDKNPGQCYVRCPAIHMDRITANYTDHDNFVLSTQTEQQILAEMRLAYDLSSMSRFGRWFGITIPQAALNPKEKDPILKDRQLALYHLWPMREPFQYAQTGLRWLLRQLPIADYPQFTLHKISDLRGILASSNAKLNDLLVFASQKDVECMFTNLKKNSGIKMAVKWNLTEISLHHAQVNLFNADCPNSRTPSTRTCNRDCITITKETKEVRWGSSPSTATADTTTVTFTFDELFHIVEIDLAFTFSKIGDMIWYQKEGCPIGGLLSSYYADVTCAWMECKYMQSNRHADITVIGVRQIDDMAVWIGVPPNHPDPQSRAQIEFDHLGSPNGVYGQGLIIKETGITQLPNGDFEHVFCGTSISGGLTKPLSIKTYNKNWQSIVASGTQAIPRYPHGDSYIPRQMHKSTIIGNLHRIGRENDSTAKLVEAVLQMHDEMILLGTAYQGGMVEKVIAQEGIKPLGQHVVSAVLRALKTRSLRLLLSASSPTGDLAL